MLRRGMVELGIIEVGMLMMIMRMIIEGEEGMIKEEEVVR